MGNTLSSNQEPDHRESRFQYRGLNIEYQESNHQVFGVSCSVFGMQFMMLYWNVRKLNTKHQIQNTLVNNWLIWFFMRLSTLNRLTLLPIKFSCSQCNTGD